MPHRSDGDGGGLEDRRRRFAATSERLALLSDEALAELVGRSGRSGIGWSGTVELDGQPLFVKRVPVTAVEAAHRHSTRNRYRLPTFYSYGVGSAGFGAYRELAVHARTTSWVLGGEADGFPMLLHARPLPRRPTGPAGWTGSRDYIRYWNGSRRIERFIADRVAATEELCLVLEHVPHTLSEWMADHQESAPVLLRRLLDTLDVLRSKGIVHFDAHYGNVVTDGRRLCLTDFGLSMDRSFDLSATEHEFLAAHQHYDHGEAIANLGSVLALLVSRCGPASQAAIEEVVGCSPSTSTPGDWVLALVGAVERLVDEGLVPVDPELVALVVRYRAVIRHQWVFFGLLQRNRRKDTPFDDRALARLLVEAGGA